MDKFLGFKTEEILTFLLLIVVGYVIAKMFSRYGCSSGDGFSVGAPSQCRDPEIGLRRNCRATQQWDGGFREFPCPKKDIPSKNIQEDWCPDFCNFDGGDDLCPKDSSDPLCTGVKSLNIPGIKHDGNKWVNQCIKGPGTAPAPSKFCARSALRAPFTNDSEYTDLEGDCPGQNSGVPGHAAVTDTCCYATTTQDPDFYQHYKEETSWMINRCEEINTPTGTGWFTGPQDRDDVVDWGFPDLTGKKNESGKSIEGNELFCYYNDSQKHPKEHKKYCGDIPEYKNGHGYFCSFPSK